MLLWLSNIMSDSATATHSVKMIDDALMWSDTGLEVWLLTAVAAIIMTK